MNRRRNGKSTKPQGYQKQLLHAMSKHLPHKGLALQSDDDRLRWTDRMLVMGGVLFSWSASSTLLDAFESSRETLVSMYKTRRRPGTTAKGFFKALAKRSPELLVTLKPASDGKEAGA